MNSKAGPSASSSKTVGKPLVPPILREVGKLAAGVASVSTNFGGSATGNFRNKHALQPGHSLMDWIRLGASGVDLTGFGSKAGNISVTPSELALHDTPTDAWLCIRGRVYNITFYLPFHPGGPDELLKGAGKDATHLFDEVHPWVNFEQILNKCYIGQLRPPNLDLTHEQIFGVPKPPQIVATQNEPSPPPIITPELTPLPKFDWIQKLQHLTLIFYTGPFSNPLIELNQADKQQINIFLTYKSHLFENEINLAKEVNWPPKVRLVNEIGKVEIVFRKNEAEIWDNYGVLKQTTRENNALNEARVKCAIVGREQVNHNTVLLNLERCDKHRTVVPIGNHVKVFVMINGTEVARSYTPIPACLFHKKLQPETYTGTSVCLMVKRYSDGNLSRVLTDTQIGDFVTISKPVGSFQLVDLGERETFIILAAGTGVTPMFAIILFLLERRIRKCQQLRFLFFNKSEADILFRQQFDTLAGEDSRLKFINVLSQASQDWQGLKGHVSRKLLEEAIAEHLKGNTYVKNDIYFLTCGPTIFTNLVKEMLIELGVENERMHFFLG